MTDSDESFRWETDGLDHQTIPGEIADSSLFGEGDINRLTLRGTVIAWRPLGKLSGRSWWWVLKGSIALSYRQIAAPILLRRVQQHYAVMDAEAEADRDTDTVLLAADEADDTPTTGDVGEVP